jgi:hypothetical protein
MGGQPGTRGHRFMVEHLLTLAKAGWILAEIQSGFLRGGLVRLCPLVRRQVGDDAVGTALGDARAGGDVAQPRARSSAMHTGTRAWLDEKLQPASREANIVYFL